MPRQNTVDFLAAFAVGTVLGIGATLLLQPQRTPRERVVRRLKPYRKQMRRSYGQARKAVRGGAGATAEFSSELASAGREALSDFRQELTKILNDARTDLRDIVEDQVRELSRGAGKARRRFGA